MTADNEHPGPLFAAALRRSRNTDPATSHHAAHEVTRDGTAGRQQVFVVDAVKILPGRTAGELARHWEVERTVFGRRLPELEPAYVRRGEPRRCSVSGKMAATWWPA